MHLFVRHDDVMMIHIVHFHSFISYLISCYYMLIIRVLFIVLIFHFSSI